NRLPAFRVKFGKEAIKNHENFELVTLDRFSNWLFGKRWIPENASKEALEEVWTSSINIIARSDLIDSESMRLDLDAKMEKIWDEVPLARKIIAVASLPVVLAGGLAVVLCVDSVTMGGATVIYAASVSEILVALGLGVTAGTAAS